MKKLLLFFALLCAFAQGAWADDGWSVWNGGSIYFTHTPANPPTVVDDWVQINSADDLVYVTLNWNKCLDGHTDLGVYYKRNYQLNVNLDLTSETWEPLGRFGYEADEKGFEGFFNGNGHTIKLKIENTDENNQGLFYEIHPTGKVWDLHVDCDIRVGNARLVGGIAGENNGTIQNCWVSGHIESSHYSQYDADLGGIAGLNENEGDILYCCVTADVKNTGGNSGVGGIAGSNEGEIYHVTFYGDVSVNHAQYNKYVGDQNQNATLEYYYDTFNQTEYDTAGPENQNQKLYARAIKYPTITTYTINNANDWNEFVMYIRNGHLFSGKTVQLAKDISVTTTVGGGESNSFQGTFDGDGHTLTLNKSDFTETYAAPFRYVGSATFRNLRVAGTINTTYQYAGGMIANIVNSSTVSIENCRSSVTINSSNHTNGGFVSRLGDNATLTISGCAFDGSFEGTGHHNGGFVGYCQEGSSATFTDCIFAPDHISCDLTECRTFSRGVDAIITNSYYTQALGTAQGTKAIALTSAPITLGNLVQDYGMVKIYDYALLFDGKYYVAMGLPGAGTEASPYLINDDGRWNLFTDYVTKGYNFNGEFVRLNADMSVVTMAGADDANSFQGTFDGYGHTLTFTKGTSGSPFGETYCAPFRHVKNAVIKNLHVDGTIYTSVQKAAGFVGESHGALTITGCRSSIAINSSKSGDGTHGGFVATLSGANNTILIDGCVFDGSFATTANTTNCGGFVGWGVYNKPVVSNSLMKPSSVPADMLIYTFARWYTGDNGIYEPTITNCYFVATDNLPTNQGLGYSFASAPANIGTAGEAYTTSGITPYTSGLLYDGRYYMTPKAISLANTGTNDVVSIEGYFADVTLTDRTLYKDGAWNTLCLPFNVTLAGSPLAGATARPLTSASISGTTLNLTFGDAVDELVAGAPYIIKWAEGANLTEADLVFSGVTISTDKHDYDNLASGDTRVRFLGTYKSTMFDATDNTVLLLGGNNKLYYPGNGAGIGAQRAYFKIGSDALHAPMRVTSFSISFGDDQTTGVIDIVQVIELKDDNWYSVDGRFIGAKPTQPGIYLNNGKKVMINK